MSEESVKTCTRCKKVLSCECFRVRLDKRDGRIFLNNTCRTCDALIGRINYSRHKNNDEFKQKNRSRASSYQKNNSDKIKVKMKAKRQTPEYKEMIRGYRAKNKEKISIKLKRQIKQETDGKGTNL